MSPTLYRAELHRVISVRPGLSREPKPAGPRVLMRQGQEVPTTEDRSLTPTPPPCQADEGTPPVRGVRTQPHATTLDTDKHL